MKKIFVCLIFLIAVFLLGGIGAGVAQEDDEEQGEGEQSPVKEMIKEKELVGEVIYFTPRFNPTVIAVGDAETNTDYSFLIDEDTKVVHKQGLNDIKVGDAVKVTYHEVTKPNRGNRITEEWLAKSISFVRAAKRIKRPEPDSEEESENQLEVLISD
ncbi:MAG: hypothetical protein KJ957_01535 [Candidatus Omnitrophica bacterium]|nr:hypothetical protein [Candidatus Omnitrophota bacterium]MBU1852711.1 hypothetical protein [Candidatus Omnitrophota bacterium]